MFDNIFKGVSGGPILDPNMFATEKIFPRKDGYLDIFDWKLDVLESEATELWLFIMTSDMDSWITYKKPRDGLILPAKKFESKYFNFRAGLTRFDAMTSIAWELLEWHEFGPQYGSKYSIRYEEMCTISRTDDSNAVVLLVTVPFAYMSKTNLPMRVIPLGEIDSFLEKLTRVRERQEAVLRTVQENHRSMSI